MTRPVLAAAGLLFILLVVVALAALVIYLVRPGRGKDSSAAPAPDDPAAAFRARYDELYISYGAPPSALIVRLVCNNTEISGAALRHYCWTDGDSLLLFPVWEAVCGAGQAPPPVNCDPRGWRIPLASIVCYANQQGLPYKFVVLQYKIGDEILTLSFSEDAARVFAELLPDKDFSHLLEDMYPKSSQNIRDIKESFISLKQLRGEGLITEDEYAAKKKELLILM